MQVRFRKFKKSMLAMCSLVLFASANSAWPQRIGCSAYIESQCDELYSNRNNGEMDVSIENQNVHLGYGNDPQSGLPTLNIKLFSAYVNNLDRLPADFRKYLRKFGALSAIRKYLHLKEDTTVSFRHYLKQGDIAEHVNAGISDAFQRTISERFNKIHPNFNQVKHLPFAWKQEKSALYIQLGAEIANAKWENSGAWKNAVEEFEKVRQLYLQVVKEDSSKDVSEAQKQQWIEDLNTVTIIVPGTERWTNDRCSSDEAIDATYNDNVNKFTVCAGAFNSSGVEFIMAHELGHLLGMGRAEIVHSRATKVFSQIVQLRKNLCEKRQLTCSDGWRQFKNDLYHHLNEDQGFAVPKPALRECLSTKLVRPVKPEVISQRRDEDLRDWWAHMANTQSITTYTVTQLPDNYKGDVIGIDNPYYFNVCYPNAYNDETQIDPSGSTLLLYLNEYLCQSTSEDEFTKMKNSFETAALLSEAIYTKEKTLGGKFSSDALMASAGFSDDVDEKYADYFGGKIMSMILAKIDNPEERRKRFFYETALFCRKRSATLSELYPEKTSAENKFSSDTHPLDRERRQQLFAYPELRRVLGCEKDFAIADCK